jgi:hypothetical protein
LWLQRWEGEWGARVKDRLERRLQLLVCAGQLSLGGARTAIKRDCKRAYWRYVTPAGREDAVAEREEVAE